MRLDECEPGLILADEEASRLLHSQAQRLYCGLRFRMKIMLD
jgi:hypothetical protein